ncbi:MAG: hypothetical protein RLZZ502_1195, partial [Pseudomonadota bacterium]
MELLQLHYFSRVAKVGSLTLAAQELGINQSQLSRIMQQLETSMGQHLFKRTGRGMKCTEAGLLLLSHAEQIIFHAEQAKEAMGSLSRQASGQVGIGLPPSWSQILAVPLLEYMRLNLPHAKLSLSEGLSLGLSHSLSSGQLDMCLLYPTQTLHQFEV